MPEMVTICDECSDEMLMSESQVCESCGGTFCERHIGDLDHDCGKGTP